MRKLLIRLLNLVQKLLLLLAVVSLLVGGRIVNALLVKPWLPNILLDILLAGGCLLLALLIHEVERELILAEKIACKQTETPEES